MKLTPISFPQLPLPPSLAPFFKDAVLFDSSCSQEARVIYLEKGEGFFLKIAPEGTLATEARLTQWYASQGLGPEVLCYESLEQKDFLLTKRVPGTDCTHESVLSDPLRLCRLLAEALRRLHETDASQCPVKDRLSGYLALAEQNFPLGKGDLSLLGESALFSSVPQAFSFLQENKAVLKNEVLIHGDYYLPNVMVNRWHPSGFIDLGNGGVGDRHVDLFWALWSLWFNCKTDRYTNVFLDAYGRDKVDPLALRTVAAAEVFG